VIVARSDGGYCKRVEGQREVRAVTKGRLILLIVVYVAVATVASARSMAQTKNIPECGVVDGDGLIAFVGEKLEVIEVETPLLQTPHGSGTFSIILDYHYRARYRVIEKLCGDFFEDVIEFDIYDHHGFPYFARYETVLLYVSRYGDRYVHQKYQSDVVHKTRSGEWARCGEPSLSELPDDRRGDFRAVPLEIDEPSVFSIAHLTEEQIATKYPSKYYSRQGDRVICKAGVTADVLYTIKRLGILKKREQLQ